MTRDDLDLLRSELRRLSDVPPPTGDLATGALTLAHRRRVRRTALLAAAAFLAVLALTAGTVTVLRGDAAKPPANPTVTTPTRWVPSVLAGEKHVRAWVLDPRTGDYRKTRHPMVRLSPDGRTALVPHRIGTSTWALISREDLLDGKTPTRALPPPPSRGAEPSAPVWSPDGRRVAMFQDTVTGAAGQAGLVIIDITTMRTTTVLLPQGTFFSPVENPYMPSLQWNSDTDVVQLWRRQENSMELDQRVTWYGVDGRQHGSRIVRIPGVDGGSGTLEGVGPVTATPKACYFLDLEHRPVEYRDCPLRARYPGWRDRDHFVVQRGHRLVVTDRRTGEVAGTVAVPDGMDVDQISRADGWGPKVDRWVF